MKSLFYKLKFLDIFIAVIVVFVIMLSSFFIFSSDLGKLYLIVKTPKNEWIYPMEENIVFYVEGSLGLTSIKIENGEAAVTDSVCSNKSCITSMPLRKNGDWTACLPNRVFLSVEKR